MTRRDVTAGRLSHRVGILDDGSTYWAHCMTCQCPIGPRRVHQEVAEMDGTDHVVAHGQDRTLWDLAAGGTYVPGEF